MTCCCCPLTEWQHAESLCTHGPPAARSPHLEHPQHVHRILNRRNKYTHRVYKDDPAIFGFNLINEPRCETWAVPDCEELLHRWLEKAAAAFRQIDDKHLLSIGSEGFFSYEDRVPVAWQK